MTKAKKTIESRRRSREIALQMLFQAEVGKCSLEEMADGFLEQQSLGEKSRSFSLELTKGTLDHLEEIDSLLAEAIKNWNLLNVAAVDRNIMRLACYEFLYCDDIPAKVSLNEAIELAKKFSSPQSSGFVNGILDKIQAKVPKKAV